MAFLFKSKKNQDRALSSRDGNSAIPAPMQGAPGRMARDDKQRATPTGSLNSIENDAAATGSPEQAVGHRRAQGSIDNAVLQGDMAVSELTKSRRQRSPDACAVRCSIVRDNQTC